MAKKYSGGGSSASYPKEKATHYGHSMNGGAGAANLKTSHYNKGGDMAFRGTDKKTKTKTMRVS